MDLTPLDVRKKSDDFRRVVRGYDPNQVDAFLDSCADRLDEMVQHAGRRDEELAALEKRLDSYEQREHALNEALLTAQELREESRAQADKSAELKLRDAEQQAESIRRDADAATHASQRILDDLLVRRAGFLRSMRWSLERFLGEIDEEERRMAAEGKTSPAESAAAEG